jgi:hypothetical protein
MPAMKQTAINRIETAAHPTVAKTIPLDQIACSAAISYLLYPFGVVGTSTSSMDRG